MTGKGMLIFSIILFGLMAISLQAATITASVDHDVVGLGDPITLKININGKGGSAPEPKLPELSAFDVYSSGRSQNISIVNGAFASALDITYILVPKKVGDFMIGPIIVNDKEGMASTEPIKVSVKQQSTSTGAPQQGQQAARPQPSQPGGDFFIDQAVDKTSPYVGEQVTLTFRFYQAINLWDQPTMEWPKYAGMTVEDLPPNNRYYQVVRGKRYLVTEIKRALFPIDSGKLTIGSPQLTIKPDDFGTAFDPFNFFDRDMRDLFKRGQPKVLTAAPIALNVKPLPGNGKPADFAGAVGKYSIKIQTDKDSVGVDEPITLKVILNGTGNIKSIPPVKLPELSDFRIYDSGNTESISNSNQVISGTKTFEQAIIPKTSGVFDIPAITMSYFEPSTATYKSLTTEPLRITATGQGLADVGGAPKNVISGSKQTFGYIVTSFPKPDPNTDLARSFMFWLLQFIPMAAVVAAIAYRTRSKKLLSDRGYARRVGASRRLRSIFKTAVAFKDKKDYAEFYGALSDAVLGFVADRLNLEKAGLTIDDVRSYPRIPDQIRGELADFLETCQSARYSPRGVEKNHADNLLEKASSLVSRLEKAI